MQERPCRTILGHDPPQPDRCRICWNACNRADYAELYGMPVPNGRKSPPPKRPMKPHLTIQDIAAKRKRCRSLAAQGLPCNEFDKPKHGPLKWAVGVTTVGKSGFQSTGAVTRYHDLLPQTLKSITVNGGFPKPHLFVDGISPAEISTWGGRLGLEITGRPQPALGTRPHWYLSFLELYARNPDCDRFAMFQDDCLCMKNLRQYLDECQWPEKGYLNLLTIYENEKIIQGGGVGWKEASYLRSGKPFHNQKPQTGRGAVGLVFSRESVRGLLSDPHLLSSFGNGDWRRRVDGGIVETMNRAGFREYVHNPSLIQHIGDKSTMGSKRHPEASTFLGESHDALSLLPVNAKDTMSKG